jgi:hypothetical protein
MADKQFKCTHCQAMNTVHEADYNEIVASAGGKAALTLLATVLTLPLGGIGGLLAGTYFSADGVYNYAFAECTTCNRRFPIARWTKGD